MGIVQNRHFTSGSMVNLIAAILPLRDMGRLIHQWRLSSTVWRNGLKLRLTNSDSLEKTLTFKYVI